MNKVRENKDVLNSQKEINDMKGFLKHFSIGIIKGIIIFIMVFIALFVGLVIGMHQ